MTDGGASGSSVVPKGILVSDLLDKEAGLELQVRSGRDGVGRTILDMEVQKPGLVMTGLQPAHPHAVHVIGLAEYDYLRQRDEDGQRTVLAEYVGAGVPCVVVCRGLEPSAPMLAMSNEEDIPMLVSPLPTGVFIRRLRTYLRRALAPRVTVHGVFVQVHNVGVLLTGKSGIGKSETALELMLRGHRLVADDVVELVVARDTRLVGRGRPPLGHYMEIRGLGVLNAGDLFGQAAVLEEAPLGLVTELVAWTPDIVVERTGIEDRFIRYLGVSVPHLVLPVRPGRNIATIVEVAARNQILKSRGVCSVQRFEEELNARLASDAISKVKEKTDKG